MAESETGNEEGDNGEVVEDNAAREESTEDLNDN